MSINVKMPAGEAWKLMFSWCIAISLALWIPIVAASWADKMLLFAKSWAV